MGIGAQSLDLYPATLDFSGDGANANQELGGGAGRYDAAGRAARADGHGSQLGIVAGYEERHGLRVPLAGIVYLARNLIRYPFPYPRRDIDYLQRGMQQVLQVLCPLPIDVDLVGGIWWMLQEEDHQDGCHLARLEEVELGVG